MWPQQGNSNTDRTPFTGSLSTCVNKVVSDGYGECFKVTARGLYSTSRSRYYRAEQVQIVSAYHFEAQPEPHNVADVYLMETSDGLKGTLIDAYGDTSIHLFVAEVEEIRRKMSRHDNRNFC